VNRFFIATYYEDGRATAYSLNYQGYTPWEHDLKGTTPPAVVFYENKKHRDADVHFYAQRWPGVKFVTGEITGGAEAKSSPAVAFSVSNKGVLPV